MNLTQRELTSIIASAVQAALAAQPAKPATRAVAKPVARKRTAAKPKLVVVRQSAKAARNAATGTTRAERAEHRREWNAAITCGCKPFADIRTVARWKAEGLAVAADAEPVQVAKSGAELYCRHALAS